MTSPLLSVGGLAHRLPTGRPLWHSVSFEVRPGEVLAVVGPNGAGKTTLLRTLAGLQTAQTGTRQVRGRVAYVPQATQLNLPYRVRDVVAMGRVASSGWFGPRHVSDRAAIDRALVQMGLADLGDRTFTSLSGGERQLVVAARALATECGILVLDEPMAALDLKRQAHTLGVLQRLAARGTGIVFSTHQPDHALHVASSVLGLGPDANTLYGPTRDVCTEANLTRIYGVDVRLIDVQSTRGPVTGAIPLIHPALASSEL